MGVRPRGKAVWVCRVRELLEAQQLLFHGMKSRKGEVQRKKKDTTPDGVGRALSQTGATEWFLDMWNAGGLRGADLVYALQGTDNVARADRALAALEKAGWIERGKVDPDPSATAFRGLEVARGKKMGGYPRDHFWMPSYRNKAAAKAVKVLIAKMGMKPKFRTARMMPPQPKKTTKKGLQVGDTVAYTAKWMRSVGLAGDRATRKERGVIVSLSSDGPWIKVKWKGDREEGLVHPKNVRKVRR